MAFPTTISGAEFPNNNYFCGPFKSSEGAFYVALIESTGNTPEVYKSTDPPTASSFTAQDTSNNPVVNNLESLWAYQEGDVLHIATYNEDTPHVQYHQFNMGSDTWIVVDQTIEAIADRDTLGNLAVSVAVRGAGDPCSRIRR